MRQSIVTYAGRAVGAGDVFNMSFDYPPPRYGPISPTANQRAAVADFFGFDLEGETECQAHALLTYRDYAKAAAARVFPRLSGERILIVARAIAAFISVDPVMREDVMQWADRRWRAATDPDSRERSISRTKHFHAVQNFAHAAVADLRDAGAGF